MVFWSRNYGYGREIGGAPIINFSGALVLSSHRPSSPLLTSQKNKKRPKLKFPLLHLPLSFPPSQSHLLTTWTIINLHLPTFIPYFSQMPNSSSSVGSTVTPYGPYSHIAYVRVYANCRLRRIWFDDDTAGSGRLDHPWEFDLFSAGWNSFSVCVICVSMYVYMRVLDNLKKRYRLQSVAL